MYNQRYANQDGPTAEDGQVVIQRQGNGTLLVLIGRGSYTKRFQLIGDEGPALLDALTAELHS